MRSLLDHLLHVVKVFIVFVFCAVAFYFGLLWLDEEYRSYHQYEEPEGNAVKVIGQAGEGSFESMHWLDRLELFMKIGE